MTDDLIGYDQLMQDAMREVVRNALVQAQGPRGLPGKHHFYITFRTRAPGVSLPEHLLQRYPDDMTIVLEHQFWDLEVYPDRFRVLLKFGGSPHPVVVPFSALTRFFDPSVKFGLQFEQSDAAPPRAAAAAAQAPAQPAPPAAQADPAPQPPQEASGAVVSLDAFRKK
ncbi:MAG: stringent starvation protein B [Alphaproteobacteria bacterium]|nr:stringent starvation protein B [Alphaproteobacteria bacterium]